MTCDIYLVGVGGQGVLTIGEVLTEAAQVVGIPTSFYPTKGMAQRGGFVKAQLRLGRESSGVGIAERSADLVIAMERSEALKAIRYVRPGGTFLLYAEVWQPVAVLLGNAPYPGEEDVLGQIEMAGAAVKRLDPADVPLYGGLSAPANMYVLGVALSLNPLDTLLPAKTVLQVVEKRWKDGAERNRLSLEAGLQSL